MVVKFGTAADDFLDGTAGDDYIAGYGGHDFLDGAEGADTIYGGLGADIFTDGITGGAGDRLYGESGSDWFRVRDIQADYIHGGTGADFYEMIGSLDSVVDLLNPSANRGLARGDMLVSIEILQGGTGNDRFFGSAANELFNDGRGADFYNGRGGYDIYSASFGVPGGAVQTTFELAYGARAAQLASLGGVTLSSAGSGVAAYRSWDDANGSGGVDPGEISWEVDELLGIEAYQGRDADDVMRGSAGNEVFHAASAGIALVDGGAGFDFLVLGFPSNGADLDLVAGTMTIGAATSGIVRMEGAIGTGFADTMAGNGVANTLLGSTGTDLLQGRGGADRLQGDSGEDILQGGDGDDVLSGGEGGDVLDGGAGSDTAVYITYGAVTVNLAMGRGTDGAEAEGDTLVGVENVIGSGKADEIFGDGGANRIEGRDGADSLVGGEGNDRLHGEHAADSPVAQGVFTFEPFQPIGSEPLPPAPVESADDMLDGEGGNDQLSGGEGADRLRGGTGSDRLDGGAEADRMIGGTGNDVFVVDDEADVVIEGLSGGRDTIFSALAYQLGGNLEALRLTGVQAIDGRGNALGNAITGNVGANLIEGLGGADRLSGGGGSDELAGGAGEDLLTGGPGDDLFVFDAILFRAPNVDVILDFVPADDTILLDRQVFAGIANDGRLAAGAFRIGTAAGDAGDRIIYHQATGRIFYDADGTGQAAAVLFARVDPDTALSNLDFRGF